MINSAQVVDTAYASARSARRAPRRGSRRRIALLPLVRDVTAYLIVTGVLILSAVLPAIAGRY